MAELAAAFDVHVEPADGGAVHVVPEHQALSVAVRFVVRWRLQPSEVARFTRGGRLDVHVVS